ncbi:hypothetical protein [Marinomonas sp.]|uniref:hypothetical protein n=1 Tax=Marinomonas sp. TaxID=1904862 RepID=UPI003BAC14C6
MLRIYFLILSLILVSACSTQKPSQVIGSFPEKKPPMLLFYEGNPLPREQTSMLVTAHYGDQTDLYITAVDDIRKESKGLIGGALAAIVLPGTHDVSLQFYDRGRMTIPLKLEDLTVQANIGYLINFNANFPPNYDKNPYGSNDAVKIQITVSNLDTDEVVHDVTFNGWGQKTVSAE